MLFNSFEFLVFLPLFFGFYWFVFKNSLQMQNIFVFVASYFFYAWWDWRFLFLITLSSSFGFLFGLFVERLAPKQQKVFLSIVITINLLFLGVFKYYNFFVTSFESLFMSLGYQMDLVTLNVLLPAGISFYTFHNISYIVDVYRKDIKPTKDPIIYLSFMSYFPQLIAGPIQRAKDLIPQFEKKREFRYSQAVEGLQQALWGFFKKIVIADNCATLVNEIFAKHESLSVVELFLGIFYFAWQIYGDFSGYTDIALGVSKLFGINLTTNFKTPYFARTIPEFWRKWHISLTTWFKDYLYIPLGGNQKGFTRTIMNTLIIFLVSGIWHGANWTFVIWGLLNALFFIPYLIFPALNIKRKEYVLSDVLNIAFTFLLICFSWIFFRAETIHEGLSYAEHLFSAQLFPGSFNYFSPYKVMPLLVIFISMEFFLFKVDGYRYVASKKTWLNWLVYIVLIVTILYNIQFFTESQFIYFQF